MQITLANLAEATPQQVFDQVAAHLLQQNKQSKASLNDKGNPGCAYRGDGGLMCAAGCLIADSEYDPAMDKTTPKHGTAWSSLVGIGAVPSTKHDDMIGRLQSLHDIQQPHQWRSALASLAADFDLVFKA